jgi:hypothetical protein
MSDTVSSTAIVAGLGSDGLSFLPDTRLLQLNAAHVAGGVQLDPGAFSLSVEFSTLAPDFQTIVPAMPATDPATTVSGYAAMPAETQPAMVAGALQQTS